MHIRGAGLQAEIVELIACASFIALIAAGRGDCIFARWTMPHLQAIQPGQL